MDWNNSEIYLGKAKKCLNFRATASWILSMMNYEENKNVGTNSAEKNSPTKSRRYF